MFKLFTILLLTVFLWMVLQLVISAFKVFSFFKTNTRHPKTHAAAQNTMVKCAACNLYVLDSEAITRNGLHFCSIEHAKNS